MKHVVNIIIIVAAMAFVSIAVAAKYEIDTIKETVVAHDHIVKGKAHYLPGKICIIDTGAETEADDITLFARACAKAHREWLETPTENEE